METINHEYYVSLEVAKLLKEAGFDLEIYDCYIIYENGYRFTTEFQTPHNFNGNNGDLFINYRGHKEVLSRPTLEVAQRWLREVKGVYLDIDTHFNSAGVWFSYVINVLDSDAKFGMHSNCLGAGHSFNEHKEAQESGIKKALEIILEIILEKGE